MNSKLLEFKKNIISWYPIEEKDSVLLVNADEEISNEVKNKTKNIIFVNDIHEVAINAKFDYVVLIGNIEKLASDFEIKDLLEFSKKCIKNSGKILLAMQNKFGMKYWTGDKFEDCDSDFSSITASMPNIVSYNKIKTILDELKLKYKFYYPLPDYKYTNVIYTDEFMPDNDSIDARILTYCENGEMLNFSEREAFKQLIIDDAKMFPFFSNSYFIEISNTNSFEEIKYVSYGITRNEEFRIKTIVGKNVVYKTANSKKAEEHIQNVKNNINILKNCKIDCLDKYDNNKIISKYLKDATSFDKVLMDIYNNSGLDGVMNKIIDYKVSILNKLSFEDVKNTVFEKYSIKIDKELKDKLHFTKNGVFDLIFQNCLVKNNKIYVYDQEWFEEDVPVEFILYRAIFYFTDLKEKEDINIVYEKLGLSDYVNVFEELETKLQEKILDKEIWKLHEDSVKDIGKTQDLIKNYREQVKLSEIHIKNLETQIEGLEEDNKELNDKVNDLSEGIFAYKEGIENLTNLIKEKDVELVNYANELRSISTSMSWKITKPLRMFMWMFNPKSGASFIDRIMPPGGKRRIEYDKKQTEKRYAKKVENYFKLSDEETAEFWKGIDHRKYLKYEKCLEKEKEDELSDYEKWIMKNEPNDQDLLRQEKTKFKIKPKISIVIPLYNTDTEFFRELLYTIHTQTYKKWELCLADGSNEELTEIKKMVEKDKRIKYKFLGENKGISGNTNEALKMATGDYISLVDHDDILSESALYEVVKTINENPDVDFIYSDEDKFHFMDESYYEPHFKPDFAPDTLRANNYICHYSVFKKELIDKIGGFNSEFDGAQDYDLILRATENANRIIHIPKVLYHWRVHKGSTSFETEAKPYAIIAGRKAVASHLERVGLKGKVYDGVHPGTYEVVYDVNGNPKVSILIPNKDGIDMLKTCIESVLKKSTYQNYEIVIIENNSEKTETYDYYKELLKNDRIKIINYNTGKQITSDGECSLEYTDSNRVEVKPGFNYSAIINFGVRNSDGEFIVQLNNDTELLTANWLEKMIGFCQRDDVGACGVRLFYPDDTIQHAGIIVGALQVAAHVFRGLKRGNVGYFGREDLIQNMNAVTAACIMTRREIYEKVGFMNEEFAVAFNDIDFCLKIRRAGYLIVFDPYIELTHYESKSRGNDMDPDKIERFQGEINLFLETWKEKLAEGDEYYSPNLSLDSDQYAINI